jgi:hypothetical protein
MLILTRYARPPAPLPQYCDYSRVQASSVASKDGLLCIPTAFRPILTPARPGHASPMYKSPPIHLQSHGASGYALLKAALRVICGYHSFYGTPLGAAEASDELDPAQWQGRKCTREGGQV